MEAEIWRLGDLELDVGQQCVLRAEARVELPRLSFDLLLALMRAAPNFVSNEELMTQVWRGLIVSPETVTQRVKLLRDALGDDPRQPRYIEGLRGRGYRMIPDAVTLPASTNAAAPRHRARWWVAGAAVTMALTGLVMALHDRDPESGAPTLADRTAAILPFPALGNAAQSKALSTGLIDSVVTQLSGVRGLHVVSSNSSSHVDVERLGPQEAGRQLGARYLVQGLVQQSGGELRVTAKLLDSNTGEVLWTRQFDRPQHDFFGMQDAVASGVVQALQARIAGLDPAVPAGVRSKNVEAQLAYLRGRALLGRTTVAGSVAAEAEFSRAMARDPSFVPAVVGLYDARMQAANLRKNGMAEALAANAPLLAQAEQLDSDSGAVLLARAMWQPLAPEMKAQLYEAGLKQDPANARAMTAYSELLDGKLQRRDEGKQWLERAMRIDPLWPRARFRAAQRNFATVGSAVEQQMLKLLELDPNYYPALQRHAKYRWQLHGEIAYPVSVIERAIAADPENPWAPHTGVAFYLDAGDPRAAQTLAAANSVVAASTAALRASFTGDWRKAGEAALAPGSFVFNNFERWGVAAALRDYALRTKQFDRVMHLLSERYSLPLDDAWKIDVENFREGELLAHLLLAGGRREEGLKRLDAVIAWIDANTYMGPVYNLRVKAQALALKGQADDALALLAESFRQNDYTQWWYTLQFDPTWDGLRNDARFLAIASDVRAHVATEIGRLQEMRRAGQIPDRAATDPSAPARHLSR